MFSEFYEAAYVPVNAREKELEIRRAQYARDHANLLAKFTEAINVISNMAQNYEAQRVTALDSLTELSTKMASYEQKLDRLKMDSTATPLTANAERTTALIFADYKIAKYEYAEKLKTCIYMGSMVSLSCCRLELLKKQLTTLTMHDSGNELIKCRPLIKNVVESMDRTVREQEAMFSTGVYTALRLNGDAITADAVKSIIIQNE